MTLEVRELVIVAKVSPPGSPGSSGVEPLVGRAGGAERELIERVAQRVIELLRDQSERA